MKMKILGLIFLAQLMMTVMASSVPPVWAGTNLIQSGVQTIVISGTHQNVNNTYTHIYSPAFSSTPFTALGIISMETTNLLEPNLKFHINLLDYTSTAELKLAMNIPTETSWETFKASYIAVDSVFTMVKTDYFSVNNPAYIGTGSGLRSFRGKFTLNIGSVDTTHKISIIPLLTGLICNTANGEHSVSWQLNLNNATSINYNFTVNGNTTVTQFRSYILVVDKSQLQFDQQQYLDEIYITGTNSISNNESLIFFDTRNIFAGLNSFNFQEISFNLDLGSLSLTTNGAYKNLNISVWSFRQRNCDPINPYYEQISNLCYDTCPNGYANKDGSTKKFCQPCQQLIAGCKLCAVDGSTCSEAFGNYIIVEPANTSCICPIDGFYESSAIQHRQYIDKCRNCHYSCKACSGDLATQCVTCDTGLTLQVDNSCSSNKRNLLSCSVQQCLTFSLLQIIKLFNNNTLNISLSILQSHSLNQSPSQPENIKSSKIAQTLANFTKFIDQQNLKIIINPSQYNISPKSITFNSSSLILSILLSYTQTIHNKQITLHFRSQITDLQIANPLTFQVLPTNNLVAISYDEYFYSIVQVCDGLIFAIVILCLSLMVFSLFYRKMIGLELITMVQLLFFGEVLSTYSYPLFHSFNKFKYVNGFNGLDLGLNNELSATNFSQLNYYKYLLQNYNLMLLLSLVLYLAAFILFLIGHFGQSQIAKKSRMISQLLLRQICFGLMIFSCNNYIVSFAIFIIQGTISDSQVGSKISLVLGFTIIIIQVIYFIYLRKKNRIHSDSRYFYKIDKSYTHYTPLLLLTKNIVIIIFMTLNEYFLVVIACYVTQIMYMIAILIINPYQFTLDYVRFFIVQATLFLYFVLVFVWETSMLQHKKNQPLLMIFAIVILVNILVAIILTIVSLCKHMFRTMELIKLEIISHNETQSEIQVEQPDKKLQQ